MAISYLGGFDSDVVMYVFPCGSIGSERLEVAVEIAVGRPTCEAVTILGCSEMFPGAQAMAIDEKERKGGRSRREYVERCKNVRIRGRFCVAVCCRGVLVEIWFLLLMVDEEMLLKRGR